jgi:POT family proton-dependent oligopeptide transporter
MAVGHFLMAVEAAFLVALAFLIVGCGLMKGNIAAQVGGLYDEGDKRRDDAFQIFIIALNAGVIAAPLVCGTLGEKVGFHWGFGAAGVGMIVAIVIYLAGYRHLPKDGAGPRRETAPSAPLTAQERRALVGLIVLVPILSLAWVGNNQTFNAYLIWVRQAGDLNLFGFTMPVTWLLSIDSALSMVALAAMAGFWRVMAARGFAPSELTKIAIGIVCWVIPYLMIAACAWVQTTYGLKTPLAVLIAFHIVNELAYANVLPVTLSLYAGASPKSLTATMISVSYLQFVITNFLVGWVGSFYEKMDHTAFWLLHAGFGAVSAVAIVALYRPLSRAFAPAPAAG